MRKEKLCMVESFSGLVFRERGVLRFALLSRDIPTWHVLDYLVQLDTTTQPVLDKRIWDTTPPPNAPGWRSPSCSIPASPSSINNRLMRTNTKKWAFVVPMLVRFTHESTILFLPETLL